MIDLEAIRTVLQVKESAVDQILAIGNQILSFQQQEPPADDELFALVGKRTAAFHLYQSIEFQNNMSFSDLKSLENKDLPPLVDRLQDKIRSVIAQDDLLRQYFGRLQQEAVQQINLLQSQSKLGKSYNRRGIQIDGAFFDKQS